MSQVGPVALAVATLVLLAICLGIDVRRTDGLQMSARDGLWFFSVYVLLVLSICMVVDAVSKVDS